MFCIERVEMSDAAGRQCAAHRDRHCMSETAERLPAGVRAYKRTAVFDERTIPAALRQRHSTKPGVWALIRIIDGRLRYRVIDTGEDSILDAQRPGLVLPAQLHEVEPLGPVRFFVEFHRADAAGEKSAGDMIETAAGHE